jgi:hypothetical protein
METGKGRSGLRLQALVCGLLAVSVALAGVSRGEEPIDRARVKELYEKSKKGDKLTPDEQKYLDRAIQEFKKSKDKRPEPPGPIPGKADEKREEQKSTGLVPLTEMTALDRYKGEDGGLYGGGKNEPPRTHQLAAQEALRRITPLDGDGKPATDGKIVFISLGMSNTSGEFRLFVRPEQVQVAWIKHAEPGPLPDTSPLQYARKVKEDIAASLAVTRAMFPNLRVAYLSSRIYGGYNIAGFRRVNPEPFAYETAFSVRWVIEDQINREKEGKVEGPVLLWGPYLWADGVTPRRSDKLVWERKDLGEDGVHPS